MKKIITIILYLCSFYLVSAQSGADSIFGINIKGRVMEASTDRPLEGINVAYSSYTSAFTDSLGEFMLSVPNTNISVTVSADGFQPQQIPLKQRENIEIFLYEDNYPSMHQLSNEFYSIKTIINNPKAGFHFSAVKYHININDIIPCLELIFCIKDIASIMVLYLFPKCFTQFECQPE